MKKEYLTRQLDLLPLDLLGQKITVIGAGAIGSFTVLGLTKMGFSNIKVLDMDEVSEENMSCQWFRYKDIGKKKVHALAEMIADFTSIHIEPIVSEYRGGELDGIVISAVDSMEVRRLIFNEQHRNPMCDWVIDPRMASEYALMYVMDPKTAKDRESYRKSLYTDSEAVQERCTAKSTMYTAQMISGLVCKAVKDLVRGDAYPRVSDWNIKENFFKSYKGGGNE